jgi:signal transduction histidine kinase
LTRPLLPLEAAAAREVQTLSGMLLIVTGLIVGAPLGYALLFWEENNVGIALILLSGVLMLCAYYAARWGHVRSALIASLIIGIFYQWFVAISLGGQLGLMTTYFMIISTLFAASFVSIRAAVLIALIVVMSVAVITPTLAGVTFITTLQGPLAFHVIASIFVILFIRYWRNREDMRVAQLMQSEKRYHLISEHLTDFHFYYHRSESGVLLLEWVTPSYSKVTGYPIPSEKRPPPSHLYLPDDLPMVEDARRRALAGERVEVECRFKRFDGEVRWAIIQYFPEWDEAHTRVTGYYGALTDVNVRKREEEQRLQIAVKQEQFNLMRQFVDAMSHDFRTRLSVLENNRYLIGRAMDAPLRDRLLPRLDTMHQTIFQLNTQIDNLGAVTSLTDFRLSSTPLHEMFAGLQQRYQARAQAAGLRYEQRVDMDMPVAIADTAKLETAIGHLLDNAILHGTGGTRVSLLAERWEGYVAIEVEDDGVGISEQDMQHIFAPFFKVGTARTVEEHGGIGVGLTLVKMIVEGHHGEMAIRSTKGEGTCVRLLIPRDRSGESSASLRLPGR